MSPQSRWLPVGAWAATIWIFSGETFGGDGTSFVLLPLLAALLPGASPDTLAVLHGVVRKLAHVTEFAILAGLLVRALRQPGRGRLRTLAGAVALGLAWAVIDEIHQTRVPGRVGSPFDVGFDGFGVLLGAFGVEAFSSDRRLRA